MKLIEYDEGKGIKPSPHIYNIKPFDRLLERQMGMRVLSYIFLMVDYKSPYMQYDEEVRKEELVRDVLDGDESQVDELVEECIQKYSQLQETALSRLLKASLSALHKMEEYFNTIDFTEKTNGGALVHKPKELMDAMNKIGPTSENLVKLEQQIKEQEKPETEESIRGGVETNEFNKE